VNDQELRALVRAAVERHLRPQAAAGSPAQDVHYEQPAVRSQQPDASHYVYVSLTNVGDACVIEPNVPCNHCNYCKSHGH
jgi:hypothetical protein